MVEFLNMTAKEFRTYINSMGNTHNLKEVENKYHAKKKKVDGKTFASTKESKRYMELKALQRSGGISGLECQKAFELVPNFEYHGQKYRGVSWVADFYYCRADGQWIAEDVKSAITRQKPEYRIKMKLFMLKYPKILFNEFL